MKLSDLTRKKISEANSGKNHPFFGRTHSEETRLKMSAARGGSIIYLNYASSSTCLAQKDMNTQFIKTFISPPKGGAAKYLSTSDITVMKYARSGKIFQDKYILSLKEL